MANIIVADDHPIVLSGIEAVLTEGGHSIAARCARGEDVLAVAGGDLLLVDLWMPGGSGLDVARMLKKRADTRPLILMTGGLDGDALRDALALGVAGVVLKVSPPALMLACIAAVIAGERWIDPGLADPVTAFAAAPLPSPFDALNDRERAIVRMVATGMRNRDIGEQQGMTEANVKVTLHRIYERLGVSNRVELAMLARGFGERGAVAA